MNRKQRITVIAGLLISAAMAGYPPWRYTLDFSPPPISRSVAGTHAEHFAGYAPVISPPSMEISHLCEVFGLDCKNRFFGNPAYYSVSIDVRMLSVQVLLVSLLIGAVAVAFGKEPRASNDADPPSGRAGSMRKGSRTASDGQQSEPGREQVSDESRKALAQFPVEEKKELTQQVKRLLDDPKEKAANDLWLKMQEEKAQKEEDD